MDYAQYLHLDGVLAQQEPRAEPPEHDETLFITFHQITELWFLQLLHEIDKVIGDLSAGRTFAATATFTRIRRIFKAVVGQLDVLETMTPVSFNSFRDRLDDASGFQSMQFRELEFVLGAKDERRLTRYPDTTFGIERARRRLAEPSVPDAFVDFLNHHGAGLPPADPTQAHTASEAVQDVLVSFYRQDSELRTLFELMTDVDQTLQEWRYRHVKLVERTIGNKRGTGGSAGVSYLRGTLFTPVFPDLWAIRHRL